MSTATVEHLVPCFWMMHDRERPVLLPKTSRSWTFLFSLLLGPEVF